MDSESKETPERIFRTYTSEEVIEAMEYIHKNKVMNFEFRSQVINKPGYYNRRKVIKPLCEGVNIPFVWKYLCKIDLVTGERVEDFKSSSRIYNYSPSSSKIDNLKEVMKKINSETFEGWCPSWEEKNIVNIKPPHLNDR